MRVDREPGRRPSIQEALYPTVTCFGCGPANPRGLRLRSYPDEGSDLGMVTAVFEPWPEHDNGMGYLNGGIICTVLDCHSAAAVMWEADRRGWRSPSAGDLSYVTAGLAVRYLRPSPLTEPCELRGAVVAATEAEMLAEVELVWQGKVRAAGTATWKRWRPRAAT